MLLSATPAVRCVTAITLAATGTARSARRWPRSVGWPRGRLSYCRCRTFTWCSPCRTPSMCWLRPIHGCFTASCSRPPPIHSSNSAPIPAGSADRSPPPCVAHLGPESRPAPACTRAGQCRCVARRRALDPLAPWFPVSGTGALAGISQQVPGWPPTVAARRQPQADRSERTTRRQRGRACTGTRATCKTVGGLRQAALRRPAAGARLPRSLYPSRGHLQPPLAEPHRHRGALSLQGLRPRQPAQGHGAGVDEFIRRFLLHVLPTGFMRIRHYGILANRAKQTKLARAREALACPPAEPALRTPETVQTFWLRVAGRDITLCTQCRTGHLHIVALLNRAHPPAQAPPRLS